MRGCDKARKRSSGDVVMRSSEEAIMRECGKTEQLNKPNNLKTQ